MQSKRPLRPLMLLVFFLVAGYQARGQQDSFLRMSRTASFRGSLDDSFRRHFVYPAYALEHGIEGRVTVGFTVRADGQLADVKIVRSAHPVLDREAMRIVRELKYWSPAQVDGKAVDSRFNYPVRFQIEGGGGWEDAGLGIRIIDYPSHPTAFTEPIVLNVALPDSIKVPDQGTLRVNIRWNGGVEVYREAGPLRDEAILQAMVNWLDAHPGWKPAKNEYGNTVDYVVELPVRIRRL